MIYPIVSRCNQSCIFCSACGRDDKFNIKEFENLLSKTSESLVVLSGGDPFCLPISKLLYILEIAVKYNKRIELQTNASQIADLSKTQVKFMVHLINKTGGYFNINLPSHRSDIDYKITYLRDGFKKRMKSIRILKDIGANIRITHVINKINYKYLPLFAKFLIRNSRFWNWVQFSFVKAMGRASLNKDVVPEYKVVSDYLIKAMEILEKKNFEFYVDHIPLCFLGRFYERNIDLIKIKNNIKGEYLIEKRKINKCRGCKYYKICSGPRIDYIKIYGTI